MADRPRTLILHAGMHKTGSTAIQHWLHKKRLPKAHYFDWKDPNHSTLFVLLFEQNPQNYFSLARPGYTRELAMEDRAREMENIRRQVAETDKEIFIFSAERMSSAPDEAVRAMHDFFSEMFSDIQVYAYVRKPSGFMSSMFQQHLKTGYIKLEFGKLWPDYRRRLTRLMKVFGEQNVHLRSFDKLAETGTEVVADFAQWIGIRATPRREIVRNISMTATGMSLLYYYRRTIEPEVPPERKAEYNLRVLEAVQKLPGEKFHIELSYGKQLGKRFEQDLKWISKRLHEDFNDLGARRKGARVFHNESEIIKYAVGVSHHIVPEMDAKVLDPDGWGTMRATTDRFGTLLSDTFGGWSRFRLWWKRIRNS